MADTGIGGLANGDLYEVGDSATGADVSDDPRDAGAQSSSGNNEQSQNDVQTGDTKATPAGTGEQGTERSEFRTVPLQAQLAERKLRQQAERERDELRGRLAAYQEQLKPKPNEPEQSPDDRFFSDPSGFVSTQVGNVERQLRLEIYEEMMQAQHADYDELVGEFADEARKNPALLRQFQSAKNPARFAYEHAKARREIGEVGSLSELKKSLEAKIRADVETEYRKKFTQASAAQATTSSASARGAGAHDAAPESVDSLDFNDILKGINNRF